MSLVYATLASDSFSRANENPLANGVWTTSAGFEPLQIVSDSVEAVSNGEGAADYTGITWPNDQWAQVQITAVAALSEIVIILRGDAASSNGYNLSISPLGIEVIQVLGGNETTLASLSGTPIISDIFRFGFFETTWYVFQNGAQIGTGNDSALASGTVSLANVYTALPTDTSFNNFVGGSIAQSGGSSDSSWVQGYRGFVNKRGVKF